MFPILKLNSRAILSNIAFRPERQDSPVEIHWLRFPLQLRAWMAHGIRRNSYSVQQAWPLQGNTRAVEMQLARCQNSGTPPSFNH